MDNFACAEAAIRLQDARAVLLVVWGALCTAEQRRLCFFSFATAFAMPMSQEMPGHHVGLRGLRQFWVEQDASSVVSSLPA